MFKGNTFLERKKKEKFGNKEYNEEQNNEEQSEYKRKTGKHGKVNKMKGKI